MSEDKNDTNVAFGEEKKEPVHPYAAQLGGERKYDEELKDVPSLNDLYDQWKEYKKRASEADELKNKAIIPPKEGASEEEWREYYKKIGVPDEYKVSDELDNGDFLVSMAKDLKLTEAQFKKYLEYEQKRKEKELDFYKARAKEQLATVESELREKWGTHYNENINYMKKGIDILGGDSLRKALQKLREGDIVGNDPVIIEALVKAGKLFSEDQLIPGAGGGEEKPKPAYPSMMSE